MRLESIWIANLVRHGANDQLLAEHRASLGRYERSLAAVEARITELAPEQESPAE